MNIQALGTYLVIILIVVLAIYIAVSIFLNKFNKLVYGTGTALAWIPICNVYLLGKLTFNKIVGWVLVACIFLTASYSTTINGVTKTYTILPSNISDTVEDIYGLAVFILLIYAIIKYNKLKKEKNN